MLEKIKDWIHGAVIAGGTILGNFLAFDWSVLCYLITAIYGILQIVYMAKKIHRLDHPEEHGGHDAEPDDKD